MNLNIEEELKLLIFRTTSQKTFEILIDINKTVKELIECFFETINKKDLLGDSEIGFVLNSQPLLYESNDLIKSFLKENQGNIILVADLEGKI